jgi:hypothetical protein
VENGIIGVSYIQLKKELRNHAAERQGGGAEVGLY